ncbi:MAG: hypothetical protein J4O13_01045, partial [Chloroflexi bacterium]|nr:hypothetical protein [Chloroflexota bacterium]
MPDSAAAVTVSLTCDTGVVTPASASASEASPAVFTVTGFTPDPNCTATESPVPTGYTSTGTCNAALVAAGQCTITNTLRSATVTVNKDFVPDDSADVTVSLVCTSGSVANDDTTASEADPANFTVTGFNLGATCTATEGVPAGYTADESSCLSLAIAHSGNASCTIINTFGELNLQGNDTEMSTATSPTGVIDTHEGVTDYFTATSPIVSANNDADWELVLVLKDKPDAATPATITVWWQNGGGCSGGSVAGQIFATASVTVPIAVDKVGHSFTVTKVAGTVSHTFVSGDLLCMSLEDTGTTNDQQIHAHANVASTSGTTGVSRLIGPFVQDSQLDPPTSVAAATGASAGTIDLNWTVTGDAYADGYRVLRSTAAGGPYVQIAEVTPQSATSYQDTSAD